MVSPALAAFVRTRAAGRCEYCRMHQGLQGATFHVEHVAPRSQGGPTDESNLALACPSCNLHKADRVQAVDPLSGEPAPLFHPRTDQWRTHFAWLGMRVEGLTPTGRATVEALHLNHPRRVQIRQAEERFGIFPPAAPLA